jgi:hypothetical protein
MARGRFISNTLGSSRKFAKLPDHFTRLLYILLVTHADVNGRVDADPIWIRGQVLTRVPCDDDQIQEALSHLDAVDLINLYEVDAAPYLEIVKFDEHNKVRPEREAQAIIPGPTGSKPPRRPARAKQDTTAGLTADQPRTNSAVSPAQVEVEVEVEVETKSRQSPPTPPPEPDATEDEEAERSIVLANKRRANRHATSILSQQHPEVKHGLDDLQSVYAWKPTKYAIIADRILELARDNGTERTAGAINKCLSSGADIRDPLAYIRKLLSDTPAPLEPAKPKHDFDAIFSYDGRPVN